MARTTVAQLEARLDANLPALEERIAKLEAENARLRRLIESEGTGKPRPQPTPNDRAARAALRPRYYAQALADGCEATNVRELDAWIAANVAS